MTRAGRDRGRLAIAVIGAGFAGICAWDRLRRVGREVTLLEAGPAEPPSPAGGGGDGALAPGGDPVGDIALVDDEAPPAARDAAAGRVVPWPRVSAVGGRSPLWGKWVGRFSPAVFSRGGWPVDAHALGPSYASAEEWLGVVRHALPERFAALRALGAGVGGRVGADREQSPWLEALASARRRARTGAAATTLLSDGRRIGAVRLATDEGTFDVPVDQVILAASPIESCRLLVDSGARHPELGRNLTDHLSVAYHLLGPADGTVADPAGGEGALLRWPPGALPGLDAGFTVEVLGPLPLDPAMAALLAEDGFRAYPGMPFTMINALGEQWPAARRRLEIEPKMRDRLGRSIPRVRLHVSDDDVALLAHMRAMCERVGEALSRPGTVLVELGDSVAMPRLFHPGGVVRMGRGEDAPVDPWGRLREWDNVWVADAAVFATSGDAHPTLTVVAHVHRLVQRMLET